jgi:hypothetical protein
MGIKESLKTIQRTLDEHEMNGRQWNELSKAIDHVAAELGYEFRADDTVVCVKPDMEGV